jgi:hypothetical protein
MVSLSNHAAAAVGGDEQAPGAGMALAAHAMTPAADASTAKAADRGRR